MAKLPRVGVEVVVAGKAAFDRAINAVNRSIDDAGRRAEQAARRTQVLDRAYERMGTAAIRAQGIMSRAMSGITSAVGGMAPKVVAAIGTIASALTITLSVAIGIAIAAVTSLVGAFAALAGRGAAYEGIINSFEALTASVQISANALMTDLRTAAAGTISDLDLLRTANLALAGASGETGKFFGESLPKLLEIARAQARATGQDVDFLFNSLITGIKRGSPLLIDNTGLVLKVSEANEAYAESLGKTVEQLTAQEQQMALLHATLEAGEVALQTYGNASETLAEKIARARASITNILDYLAIAFQPVAKAIMDTVNSVLTDIAGFVRQAVPWLQALGQIFINAIRPFLTQISGVANNLNSPGAARAFFKGAANTFGSFLRGVVLIGAQIIQAVADIANAIADFLIGESPPPKGPLSTIDQGGRNVMLAWLDGLLGGFSLEPVERVARQVTEALGPIASFTLEQVESRLAQLDAALKPFQDRLSIVKADFDAITKIGDIALGRIERQMTAAVQALIRGEQGSGAVVRSLDAQRQAIEDALEAQRQQTEEYELQLAIAEAMQARERALLAIRQGQVGPVEQAAKSIEKAMKEATGAAPKKPKGSGSEDVPELPDAGFEGLPIENLFDIGTDGPKIKQYMRELEDAFGAGFGDAGDVFANAQNSLSQGSARLGKAITHMGTRIKEGLQPFADFAIGIQKHLLAARDHINLFVNTTVPTFFNETLPTKIAEAQAGLAIAIRTNIINPIVPPIRNALSALFDSTEFGSVAYYLGTLPTRIQTALANLGENINTHLVIPFQEKIAQVQLALDTFFNSNEEGSLKWILNSALTFITNFPGAVGNALRSIGQFFWTSFASPIIRGLNWVLEKMEQFITDGLRSAANASNEIARALRDAGLDPGLFTSLTRALAEAALSVNFGRIPEGMPAFLGGGGDVTGGAGGKATRFARGGIAGPGLIKVGERGPEYLASAARLAVFPHRVVQAIESLVSFQQQPQPYVSPALVNNNNSSVDNSRHYGDFNVYGVNDVRSFRREWAIMKAFR